MLGIRDEAGIEIPASNIQKRGVIALKGGDRRRVALVMANERLLQPTARALTELNADVVGEATDGRGALELLRRTLIDVLLCDMLLPVMDGTALIKHIRGMGLYTMPAVILMTPAPMPVFERQALEAGAYAVVARPLPLDMVGRLLDEMRLGDRLERNNASRERILQVLRSLGFSLKLRGTGYLVEAISMASRDIRLVEDLKGSLYSAVTEHFHVEPGKVEHAMRRAVESAWASGELESQHRVFGNTIDARRGKPTSGEMIARVAELLRVKEI